MNEVRIFPDSSRSSIVANSCNNKIYSSVCFHKTILDNKKRSLMTTILDPRLQSSIHCETSSRNVGIHSMLLSDLFCIRNQPFTWDKKGIVYIGLTELVVWFCYLNISNIVTLSSKETRSKLCKQRYILLCLCMRYVIRAVKI